SPVVFRSSLDAAGPTDISILSLHDALPIFALGERGLAEHVEGIAVVRVAALARPRQRLADGPAHHELVAHDLHGLAHGEADHRRSEEHTSELQSRENLVCRLLLEKKIQIDD